MECVVHTAHHTLPCLLLPRQDPSQPPRTAHALSNTGTGAQPELDTHGAGACCRRGGEVERSPAVHPEQLIVTQARDNPPLRCSLASQSETLALFSQPTLLFQLYVNVWTTVKWLMSCKIPKCGHRSVKIWFLAARDISIIVTNIVQCSSERSLSSFNSCQCPHIYQPFYWST